MAYYNPCTLTTVIDFIFFIFLVILYIAYGKSKNIFTDLIIAAILIVIYSLFRNQLHTSFGVSRDVNMFGSPMPKYCQ